ncbi:MAG TPA: cytochrome c [Gemmataceae bacterium]|jgi:mono/diheme cytochrome c family protein|nr:cytochrome c [Gemmataceae bacterium]
MSAVPSSNPFSSFDERQEEYDVQALHSPIVRELAEPKRGYERIPAAWAIAFAALLFWGGYYLAVYSGDFRSDVFDEQRPAIGEAKEEPPPVDPLVMGRRIFSGRCANCHQMDGNGRPGQFPPLAGSEWVNGRSEVLCRIVLSGLQGDVTARGIKINGNMPAFNAGPSQMNDEQAAAVLSYIRQQWGNSGPPITPQQVAAVRKETASRSKPWTEVELKALEKR